MAHSDQLRSALLDAYADKIAYGFSTKPNPVAGSELSESEKTAHRAEWLKAFGMDADVATLRYPTQVHGDQWLVASETVHAEVDGIWLDVPSLPAVVFSADCTTVLLYAPDIHQGMALHCGWKSTAQSLAQKGANHLIQQGACVQQLIAVIGPALSLAGFEVGEEVIEQLALTVPEATEKADWSCWNEATQKSHASVPKVNALQLTALGVTQIELLPFATDTHPDWFWSFRSGDWQRQGSFLMLR
jgi:polyphenol oxidase